MEFPQENMIELGAANATDLLDEILDEKPEDIIFDQTDKYNQGRCAVIFDPTSWIPDAIGEYGTVYICLDAGAWGTVSFFKTQKETIFKAKNILKMLEKNT